MDGPTSSEEGLQSPPQDHKTDALTTKKRRVLVQRNIVTVRVEARDGKQKGEAPPSDSWSWRKYGQKPLKGSPYPRGYYRCSTSKGCSAKKQVERCRTDASVFIITYTSKHNHPGPDIPSINSLAKPGLQIPPCEEAYLPTETCEHGTSNEKPSLQKPLTEEASSEVHDHLVTCNEKATTPSGTGALSVPKSEDNDFFDELEELPICTSFIGLGRSSFFMKGFSSHRKSCYSCYLVLCVLRLPQRKKRASARILIRISIETP